MTAVYEAIGKVSRVMATQGIAKGRQNQQQGYSFRGIDEVMNALAPVLSENGLVILPRMVARTCTERTTQKGGVLFYVVVEAEFDFVATSDGSKHTVRMFGEAMDSADKATNKAMSAAYKYAAFQTFCIPLAGTPDADAVTHDVQAEAPEGYEQWALDIQATADTGMEPLRAAWQASKKEYRTFAGSEFLDKLKARAAKAPEAVPA